MPSGRWYLLSSAQHMHTRKLTDKQVFTITVQMCRFLKKKMLERFSLMVTVNSSSICQRTINDPYKLFMLSMDTNNKNRLFICRWAWMRSLWCLYAGHVSAVRRHYTKLMTLDACALSSAAWSFFTTPFDRLMMSSSCVRWRRVVGVLSTASMMLSLSRSSVLKI